MKLNEVFSLLEEIAPVALSNEFCAKYGAYDNSGIIINSGNSVTGILFSLDFSLKAVEECKRLKYNLIVTHHPAIYGGIKRINPDCDAQSNAIAQCIKLGISVISMHLNFDAAPKGIDYYLMRGLGGINCVVLNTLENGGYGRVFNVEETLFNEYAKKIGKEFKTERALFYGSGSKKVNKVASFCGAGSSDKTIAFAKQNAADVYVSADMKHHEISDLLENGINVIHITHYASEAYGFEKIYEELKVKLSVASAFFTDKALI